MNQHLSQRANLILHPSYVNKTEFPLHLVLKELAELYGMNMCYDFRRNIIKNKNYVDTSVQGFKTINKETIMILQKR